MKDIYTFTTQTKVNEWLIVKDCVMSGISKSSFVLTDAFPRNLDIYHFPIQNFEKILFNKSSLLTSPVIKPISFKA